MPIKDDALAFFDACETGKGWAVCQQWCRPDAVFTAQADALAGVNTVQDYTEWMAHLAPALPDMRYEMLGFAVDEERSTVVGAAVFHATHTGEGGPVPPTGKSIASDYCYVFRFNGGKIANMTKIWNDAYAMREAGWA
ncbi:nuclear transport factor 2 family protein [Altererythrobacter sp. KTW20L]|uniref:ester cyclase n=1 Tax=Altererythrobacter sp. KTW20L TaxID=2942210 RepID=UPI0020C13318|nr:nuclear transport factor 2 family protein [Altererythrobacter sp. KTW20L]MCL6251979.1 nuclear transport factor 2 family protein [Altererythrobacter sp. KTW20L]